MTNIAVIINKKHEKQVGSTFWLPFKKAFPSVKFYFTEYSGHATKLASEVGENGNTIIVAVGGDGTINEVVNGMMLVSQEFRKTLSLAILPVGTGNDFVKSTHLDHSLEMLILAIQQNYTLEIDLGSVTTFENGSPQLRYFANIADAGLGGLVAQKFSGLIRWLPASLAYHFSILKAFISFKHPVVKIKGDNFEYEGKLLSLVAANGQWFGGGLGIAPHANISDGELAFVILGDVTILDYLKYLPKLKKKQAIQHPNLHYYKGKSCELEAQGENLIEVDGEFLGSSPAKMKIHPKAISLIGILSFLLVFFALPLWSQKTDRVLEERLKEAVLPFNGDLGLYVYDLKKDKSVAIDADRIFPTASIVKIPILIGIMDKIQKGELSYHQKLIYKDSLFYAGEDILGSFKDGESIELSKVLMLMLTTSDNTASLWLQKLAGTGTSINELMSKNGFEETRVNSRTPGREKNRDVYGWGQSTPKELVKIIHRIWSHNLLGNTIDNQMIRLLGRNYWDEEGLSEIPAGIFTASKNGAVNASRSEVILVNHPKNPYIFCVMTANNNDTSWDKNNEAWVLTRKLSKQLWQYFNK